MLSGKRQHRRSLAIVCIAWTVVMMALHTFSPRFRDLEWATRDQLARFGRKAPADPQVVFVAIDDASITLDALFSDEVGASPALTLMKDGFPFPRSVYGMIIERLAKAGAKTIAFDMLFPAGKETDPPFAEALETYADRVVIGANLEQREQAHRDDEARVRHTLVPPSTSLIPAGKGMDSRVGFVNFWPDRDDQVVRRALFHTTQLAIDSHPQGEDDSTEYFSLAARMLQKSGHAEKVPKGIEPVMFRFAEPPRPFPLFEMFVDRIWKAPPYLNGELFRDKIVLIGPYGNWVKDELNTPFGPTLGPTIHLSAVNAALRGDFLHEMTGFENILLIAVAGLLTWLLGRFVHAPLIRFVLLLLVGVGYFAAAQTAFNLAGIFPIVLSPLIAFTGSGVTFSIVEQVLDRIEKAKLRSTFERYVSRDVVKELLDNPESYLNTLGGARKYITVLFSDVRGFTTITESADAQLLVAQLNEYFNEMVRIVFEQHGTLDKFIGDAVMAQWGGITSEGLEVDARRAVSTAVQMRRALVKLNADWKQRGMLELKFGIGINHGEAIVGNLGAEVKKEVTAIGDAVNLASRLEGATKEYHLDLLIGELVAPLVVDAFLLRTVDLLQVKGKTKPVEVFTVIEERTPGAPDPDWLAHYEDGIELYRGRDFAGAVEEFQKAAALMPDDWLIGEYLRRAQTYLATPPPLDWDGVYIMTKK